MQKIFLIILTLLFCQFSQAQRIATVDWTVAETLLALGINPVGVGDVNSYNVWVKEPKINANLTADLGTRLQPNLEVIAKLDVDLFINSPMYASITPKLEEFAPVQLVNFTAENDIWAQVLSSTHEIAKLAQVENTANNYIATSQRELADLKEKLALDKGKKIAVVQFADSKNFRLYAKNSIVGAVLDHLGLENVYNQPGNLWGFINLTIDKLADFPSDTQLVVVKPYPADVPAKLALNSLWNYLPLKENVIILPETWTFGGLPSAMRFARLLVEGLNGESGKW
ncbi:hypothetical protein CJP74_06800 [Psittacicella melopsittaci]|uniref:Fe/B12 periplasmic-binding domain-containing protein n=1 Tax=Psittacicella melopsittaci TaxID=2028576 RepID=A0A3A1Y343_9GAMM|nr:iron-siderophore ABC transporter substrate-binding protein [Psittacicella melopsittaci]RIY31628.1 hypothetical protein CJP74_06800 [Psittacicella melopsittaci]